MALAQKLIRNVASNWIAYGFQVGIAFFLTPYIIHSLGETRYGIWTLVVGFTGYYGLLDLGVGAGMTQYLTRYLANNDVDNLKGCASTGFVALSIVGFLVLIGSLIIAFNSAALFRIQVALRDEVFWILFITGTGVALQFLFFTHSAIFTAVQRFDLANLIGVSTRLLSAIVTVICLKAGYGLVGLSLVVTGTNLIDYLVRWTVAGRLLPTLKISLKLVTRERLQEVISFGSWNFLGAISARLISYTDALLIAAFMPVAAVTPFAIAANLRSYFEEIFVRVGYVFFPALTALDARGDQIGLKNLYLDSSKFIFLGSILCGSFAMFWARDFLRLWVGTSYAESMEYPSVASIFYILLIGAMVAVTQRVGHQVLLGTRRVKLLVILVTAEGLSNLLLSLALIRSYGLFGVALGTLIPAILFQGFVAPLIVCRALQISLKEYSERVLVRPAILLGALLPLLGFHGLIEPFTDWLGLIRAASVMVGIIVPLGLIIGLSRWERELLLHAIGRALRSSE